MFCRACDTYDVLSMDGLCRDCDLLKRDYLARRPKPVEAPQKPQKAKPAPAERICAHKPCTNVLVPSGKRGRPSVYCSAECRKVAEAEYDEERMRAKRAAAKAQLSQVLTTHGPGMHIVDVYDKEPENGWDNGETVPGLKVIGSDKPWNEV